MAVLIQAGDDNFPLTDALVISVVIVALMFWVAFFCGTLHATGSPIQWGVRAEPPVEVKEAP